MHFPTTKKVSGREPSPPRKRMGTWVITRTTFVLSSAQAHSTERATHDTPNSSLNQHHTTSPASPYTNPELRKKSVAKSDTFSSKSLACQSFTPDRTSSQQFARPKKICRKIGHIFLKIHRMRHGVPTSWYSIHSRRSG